MSIKFEVSRGLALRPEQDLSICDCGYERCLPSHSYGPHKRGYFLIHFIIDGCGEFSADGVTYRLGKNQGFLITPGRYTIYRADAETPWHYYWVGLGGKRAQEILERCGLSRQNPVFTCDSDDVFKRAIISLFHDGKRSGWNEFTLLGHLYRGLSSLAVHEQRRGKTKSQAYLEQAQAYIEEHFTSDLDVADVSRRVYLDRTHLYRVFMAELGISPSEYLLRRRLSLACSLLAQSGHSVTDIAMHCGFKSSALFCRSFKKSMGMTPLQYRQKSRAV